MIDQMLLSPVEAVETQLKVIVASPWLAEPMTSVAAVSVVSFAWWVVIANKSHLQLAIAGYLYKTAMSATETRKVD